jgi:hypothetical protein
MDTLIFDTFGTSYPVFGTELWIQTIQNSCKTAFFIASATTSLFPIINMAFPKHLVTPDAITLVDVSNPTPPSFHRLAEQMDDAIANNNKSKQFNAAVCCWSIVMSILFQ